MGGIRYLLHATRRLQVRTNVEEDSAGCRRAGNFLLAAFSYLFFFSWLAL